MRGSEVFKDDLERIKNIGLRDIIISVLDHYVNPINFEKPASSTGKHHPPFALGYGGLVRHTKAVVQLLTAIQETRPSLNWDCLYAAAILHDMWKYSTSSKWTVKDHAKRAADNLAFVATTISDPILKGDINFIADIVKSHMGRFDDPEFDINADILPEEIVILHYADMIVSRSWYRVEGDLNDQKDNWINNRTRSDIVLGPDSLIL